MALIKKTNIYPFRIPKPYDFVPGSKVDENGKTVSYRVDDIANVAFGISENMVFFISPITIENDTLTVNNSENSVSQWRINNIEYLSSEIFNQVIPFTSDEGFIRTDLLVVTNNPLEPFRYIQGTEDEVYSPSPLPSEGELRVTQVFVDHNSITVPPFDLTGYVTKRSYKIYDTGIIFSGDYVSSIKVSSEIRSFNILKTNGTALRGFSVDDLDPDNPPYDGMPVFVRNGTSENISLVNNSPTSFLKPFLFYNNENIVLRPGESCQFLYGTKFVYFVGKVASTSLQDLQSVTDLGRITSRTIVVQVGFDITEIRDGGVYVTNEGSSYSTLSPASLEMNGNTSLQVIDDVGQLSLGNTSANSTIKATNITEDRNLQLPDYDGNLTTEEWVVSNFGELISLTNTEILAISTPVNGQLYYNSTINEVVFYNGTAWKKFTNTDM